MVRVVDAAKNILYFSSFGDMRGGGQESLFQLIEHLDKNKFRPFVIVPNDGDLVARLKSINVIVIIIGLPKVSGFNIWTSGKAVKKIIDTIKRYNIDLIHTDGPRNTFYGGLAAKIKRKPLVWHIRVSEKDKYDRLLYYLSSKLIFVAHSLRQRFDWVRSSHKFVTIYNATNLSKFEFIETTAVFRNDYGIKDEDLLIASIARIEPLKGQQYLINACGVLKNKIENFYLLLIGDIANRDYFRECLDVAKKNKIEDRVIFTGFLNNIDQILKEVDIFVLPSLSEAFPRSVIEAMAANKPVIVTDVGGCSEAIENGISGFLVPPKDSGAISRLIYTLSHDSKLKLEMEKAARLRAEKMFNINRNVELVEQLYQGIFEKSQVL